MSCLKYKRRSTDGNWFFWIFWSNFGSSGEDRNYGGVNQELGDDGNEYINI